MPLIREAIVTTVNALGESHIAPLGLIAEGEGWILAPFHPSTTLDNLRQAPFAVANFGSAPCSNNIFITVTSADCAARRNGVAPSS